MDVDLETARQSGATRDFDNGPELAWQFGAMAKALLPFARATQERVDRGLDVLEIGAGYGGLAGDLLALLRPIRLYTIVDIPEVLRHARHFLGRLVETVPGCRAMVAGVTPERFSDFEDRYDLVIQTRGFMEMSPEEVAWYFHAIQKAHRLRTGGIFFSINRSKVTPLESYPFDDRWEVLRDEPWPEGTMRLLILRRRHDPTGSPFVWRSS